MPYWRARVRLGGGGGKLYLQQAWPWKYIRGNYNRAKGLCYANSLVVFGGYFWHGMQLGRSEI